MPIEIIIEGKVPPNSILLEGFIGIGFVGPLAAEYLIQKTNAKPIGYIQSEMLPPLALLEKGVLKHPIRIFHFKHNENDFLVAISEVPFTTKFAHELARELARWAKENGVKEIVSMEGIVRKRVNEVPDVYALVNSKIMERKVGKHAKVLKEGIVFGVSALLLLRAKEEGVPACLLLAEANPSIPDAKAAASIIKVLNGIYGLNIDVDELLAEYKAWEQRFHSLLSKLKDLKERETRIEKKYIG